VEQVDYLKKRNKNNKFGPRGSLFSNKKLFDWDPEEDTSSLNDPLYQLATTTTQSSSSTLNNGKSNDFNKKSTSNNNNHIIKKEKTLEEKNIRGNDTKRLENCA